MYLGYKTRVQEKRSACIEIQAVVCDFCGSIYAYTALYFSVIKYKDLFVHRMCTNGVTEYCYTRTPSLGLHGLV